MKKDYSKKEKIIISVVSISLTLLFMVVLICFALKKRNSYEHSEFQSKVLSYSDKNSSVTLVDYSKNEDENLSLLFTYTNKKSTPDSFVWTYTVKCFQNGKELNEIIIGDSEEFKNCSVEVKDNTNIKCENVYKLINSSDVEIVIYDYISNKELSSLTISLD